MKLKIFGAIFIGWLIFKTIIPNISGKWIGTLKTPDAGEYPLSYVFKVDGGNLTGTGLSPQGVLEITNGKLTDTDFTFDLSVNDNDVRHKCKYYAKGDSIGLDIFYDGNRLHSKLSRVKN